MSSCVGRGGDGSKTATRMRNVFTPDDIGGMVVETQH